jgi:hypothetical protein
MPRSLGSGQANGLVSRIGQTKSPVSTARLQGDILQKSMLARVLWDLAKYVQQDLKQACQYSQSHSGAVLPELFARYLNSITYL